MGSRASMARMPVFLLIGIILSGTPLASNFFPSFQSSAASNTINSPTFNAAAVNASMRQVLTWAESRVLPNGTATLQGTSNNLWATSLVGRTITYLQLEIGDSTTRTIIQNMTKAEHILLQNPSFINYGIWSPANLIAQFQVHLDAQKFLSRTYGLTLDPTARSDLINVTQNMHLNLPSRSDYFDTVAWTLSNAVWFAHYSGSTLPPASDFTTAVQDLNTNYNQIGATSAAADPLIEFDQLVKRQQSDGNIVTVNPYKSYLVEDFARDLDSSVYLHNNLTYAYSAYQAESYLTSLYLQSNGNFSLPDNGEGLYPTGAYHMLSIANDLRSCSSSAWYNLLTSSSKLLNYTLTAQYPDGTFRFFLNITNPGNAITTVNAVSGIVDSYLVIHNTNVLSPETPVNLANCQTISSPSLFQNLSWLYIVIPLALIIAVAIAYERKHRAKYHGLVEK